jgi:predicted ATPase/class 3 adenylate cyclase/DNA-binding XRE family transcriptional regulator
MTADESTAFGVLLRRFRTASGLTQEELAERAGLSRRGINDLERGARLLPRKDTVALLADALGLFVEDRNAFMAAARRPPLVGSPSVESNIPVDVADSVISGSDPLPSPATLPEGTVTFLFTDIEGSTRLLQQLGDAYAVALGEHQALLRAAFAAHAGREVDTQGDAFFVAFASAPEAVACAFEASRALAAHPWPEGQTLRVRMGLHTGTPQLVGDHYVGLDVHRAARIAAAGHGGQVLLSQTTRELVAHTLPQGVTLRALGAHRLKDLQQPERLYQLVLPGLPADFPPLKTLDTHQHNLAIQPTPLLGREEQITALCALLRREQVRLVTVTGAGGIGKTRLVMEVAAELVEIFADGVWFVRLSRLVDPGLVLSTIAQTLGLTESRSRPIADLLREYVADRRLLLVLDNFEQVVGAAPEVAALLEASPHVRILVTSRMPLHLRGEREYPLAPLPLPHEEHLPPEALSQYAAVALFIERARSAKPDFVVTSANAPAIAEICARLDGLPLAIELAASRVKVLLPEALLSRLSTGLALLTGGARDLEARQQTMRATIAWSEALLAPAERILFLRLAVFVGGCTLEAAEAVCDAPPEVEALEQDLLEGLSILIDHSLVQQREEAGEPRFGMLQVIREYALEQLEASGDREELRRVHADYFLALAEQAERQLSGPEVGVWLDRLEWEHDNLRAALGWACERREAEIGLRLVAALWRFWDMRGHLREGRASAERVLALDVSELEAGTAGTAVGVVPAKVRARARLALGRLALWQGDSSAATPWLEQALVLGQSVGDHHTTANALNSLGVIARDQGDLERARACFEESLALMRAVGDLGASATVLIYLGNLAVYPGDLERAAAAFTEALALFRQVGDRTNISVCLANLGEMARMRGELAEAEVLGREALALDWEIGDRRRCAEALEMLAAAAGMAQPLRQGERAARLLGTAAALREVLGAPQPPHQRADIEGAVAEARVAVGEAAWAAAFTAGRTLALEQAIAEALEAT